MGCVCLLITHACSKAMSLPTYGTQIYAVGIAFAAASAAHLKQCAPQSRDSHAIVRVCLLRRDVSEEIRAVVIDAIGHWVAAMPSAFLNDQHLKYLAWALSDRHAAVRLTAVHALQQLYKNK